MTLVAEMDNTYNYVSWGGSPGYIGQFAQVSGAYNGSTPSLTLNLDIPGRPYAPPSAASGVTGTRNSDSEITVSWGRTDTAQRPWDSVLVGMWRYGTGGWEDHGVVAGIPGQPTSAYFNNLPANYIYDYFVLTQNSVGNSGWVHANWVYTRPTAPSNVVAVLGPTGTTIPLTWTVNNYSAIGSTTYIIERSVGGGAYAQVAAGLADATTSWTDPTPGAGTNQYRILATNNGNGGAPLASAWATSNVVSTVVPPLAPTNLAPDGIAADTWGLGVTLTWTHNPGGDFAAQSHYTIEKSSNGGGTWTALASATNVASVASSHTVAPGVLANATSWMWKVKTQGGTTAGFGPFSDAATISAETTPTLSLNPANPTDPWHSLPLGVGWVYAQAELVAQTAWEANLYAADGFTLLEHQAGVGSGLTTTFAYPVADGETYVVAVRAMSGSGLWSIWVSTSTTIDLPPPAPTTLVATYQPCTGTMSLSLASADPLVGEVVTEWLVIERRVAGGEWVVLARNVDPTTTMLDVIPLTNGTNEYRVTGFSSTPSSVVNPIVTALGTDGTAPYADKLWVFLAYGPGFATVLRCRGDLSIEDAPDRAQALQPFLGRRKPSLLSGIGVTRAVSVGATLRYLDPCPSEDSCRYDSPPRDWIDAGSDAEVVCYRDFTGRRLFGMLSGVSVNDGAWPGNASLGFRVSEEDYTEVTGVLSAGTSGLGGGGLDGGIPASPIPPPPDEIDGGAP